MIKGRWGKPNEGNDTEGWTTEYRTTAQGTELPSIYVATASYGALVSLRRRLHYPQSSARLPHPRIHRICDVSLRDDVLPSCSWFSHWSFLTKFPLMKYFFFGGWGQWRPFHLPFFQHDPPIISSTIFISLYKI
jgi:hypothetical protein